MIFGHRDQVPNGPAQTSRAIAGIDKPAPVTMSPEASATSRAAVRVIVNGRDETSRMPQTAAELERQRPAAQPEGMPYRQTNDDPLAVGGPIPPTMGRVADLYAATRNLRLLMEKEVEPIKAREAQLREYIINNLSKSDDTGAAGLHYRAQIVMKDIPRAENWDLVHGYIRKHGRFDLVQRRLSDKAVKDMLDAGETIPGIAVAHVPDVSIQKIAR